MQTIFNPQANAKTIQLTSKIKQELRMPNDPNRAEDV